MKCVGVAASLPTNKFKTAYIYTVPESLVEQATFGKRVLVDFAGNKLEAYILEEKDLQDTSNRKPIIKVLDEEEVFDQKLLALAQWMSDYYLCSLSHALSIMIPRILKRKKARVVIPAMGEADLRMAATEDVLNLPLFSRLYEKGEINWAEALHYASLNELEELHRRGLVIITGKYYAAHDFRDGYIYVPNQYPAEIDLIVLRKRAPRQAEAMEMLLKFNEVDRKQMDMLFSPQILKALQNKGFIDIKKKSNPLSESEVIPNSEQELAIRRVSNAVVKGKGGEFLLYGVTGSGKTEVYINLSQTAIAHGKGVIILIPEIALTRQLLEQFAARIKDVAVLHSAMSSGERYDEWKRIKRGEAKLVIGARSAVFAPVTNLGLIIIDEEQEHTFKQEEFPRYHAREVAQERVRMENAVLLYGSATPSIETFHSAAEGTSTLLTINNRVAGAMVPTVIIEDLRISFKGGHRGLISPLLRDKIAQKVNNKEQSILFINRRGYSHMTICRECGNIASCPFCSVTMTYHRDINQNICHYCNHHAVQMNNCACCGSKHLQLLGSGTQKVEEEVKNLFPEARVERLDMDSSRKKGAQQLILQDMKNKKVDILVGTQMVAKGLDFPNVSLVGIIDADSLLNLPDFRAAERCFQLLVQAAGRAGRGNTTGEVVIQTYNPDNPVIQLAAQQDYSTFFQQEIKLRKVLHYPPFSQLLRIVFSSEIEEDTIDYAQKMYQHIEEMLDASEEEIALLGPAPCPVYKIRSRFRFQILVKCSSLLLLRSIAGYILKKNISKNIRMDIDFNPISTM